MGKKSVKENKNIYQEAREAADLTRAKAAEVMDCVSESRIEKIESEKILPQPEDVVAMAAAYKVPSLTNHYCAKECPIGKSTVQELKLGSLESIILELLSGINTVSRSRDRLIDITKDGKIDSYELPEFTKMQNELGSLSNTINSLNLWVNDMVAKGIISKETIDLCQKAIKERQEVSL